MYFIGNATRLENQGSWVRSRASPVFRMVLLSEDKLLTRTYCDETGGYVVLNVLSPRDLVFRPDLSDKTGPSTYYVFFSKSLTKVCVWWWWGGGGGGAFLLHHGGVFSYIGSPAPLEYIT